MKHLLNFFCWFTIYLILCFTIFTNIFYKWIKKQSKRYAEITLTRQFWMQVVFRIPFSKSRKSIYRYDLWEWVCQMPGVYRFSFRENKKAIKEICSNYISPQYPFNWRPMSLKHKRQSRTIYVISAYLLDCHICFHQTKNNKRDLKFGIPHPLNNIYKYFFCFFDKRDPEDHYPPKLPFQCNFWKSPW